MTNAGHKGVSIEEQTYLLNSVLLAVKVNEEATAGKVAKDLDMLADRVRAYLQRLEVLNLVERVRATREGMVFKATELGMRTDEVSKEVATDPPMHDVTLNWLRWLVENGALEDKAGFATRKLSLAVGYPISMGTVRGLKEKGIVNTETKGRRTYKIWITKHGRDLVKRKTEEHAYAALSEGVNSGGDVDNSRGSGNSSSDVAHGEEDRRDVAGSGLNQFSSNNDWYRQGYRDGYADGLKKRGEPQQFSYDLRIKEYEEKISELQALVDGYRHTFNDYVNRMHSVESGSGEPTK